MTDEQNKTEEPGFRTFCARRIIGAEMGVFSEKPFAVADGCEIFHLIEASAVTYYKAELEKLKKDYYQRYSAWVSKDIENAGEALGWKQRYEAMAAERDQALAEVERLSKKLEKEAEALNLLSKFSTEKVDELKVKLATAVEALKEMKDVIFGVTKKVEICGVEVMQLQTDENGKYVRRYPAREALGKLGVEG